MKRAVEMKEKEPRVSSVQRRAKGPVTIEAKLKALRVFMKLYGLIGHPVSESELERREKEYRSIIDKFFPDTPEEFRDIVGTPQWLLGAMLFAPARPAAKTAMAYLLDYLVPKWRKDVPPELYARIAPRSSIEGRAWRRAVLERDGRRCQHCNTKKKLHAHHIAHWKDSPFARFDVNNGITLCELCHRDVHSSGTGGLFLASSHG